MIELKIYDADMQELKIGDLVEILCNSLTRFYTRIEIRDNLLHPFDTFTYNKIKKCKELPKNAHKGLMEHFEYWYIYLGKEENTPENDYFYQYAILRNTKEKYYKVFDRQITEQKTLF